MPTASARARCHTINRRKSCMVKGCAPLVERRTPFPVEPHHPNAIIRPGIRGAGMPILVRQSYRVRTSTAVPSLISLVRTPRPLLPQPSRRIRREDPDHQVDQTADDHDLDRQREEHAEDAERDAEEAESDF